MAHKDFKELGRRSKVMASELRSHAEGMVSNMRTMAKGMRKAKMPKMPNISRMDY